MPDLNSIPPSPHLLAPVRRTSAQQMPPPPVPGLAPSSTDPALNILPSNQNAVITGAPAAPSLPSTRLTAPVGAAQLPADAPSLAPDPGPMRHPRPLTHAELHQQLEKEQEAVVNRLTRELDLLRQAQNSSVTSNASSTSASASASGADSSASAIPIIPDGRQHLLSGSSGFSIPSQTSNRERRHTRSASSASARSMAATTGSSLVMNSASSPAPIRPSATPLSRQNSTQSQSRQSLNSSPAHIMADAVHAGYFQLRSPPGALGSASLFTPTLPAASASTEMTFLSMMPATSRYEETAFYRQELDSVKRENDALKRRIRELERTVRERRVSDASVRPRSESASTTASMNMNMTGAGAARTGIARPRGERVTSMLSAAGSVGVGVPEDELRVGESAASVALQNTTEMSGERQSGQDGHSGQLHAVSGGQVI